MKNLIREILKESDDFDWVKGISINPWHQYDILHFDVEPSKEDVNMYIDMAITTRDIKNAYSWELLDPANEPQNKDNVAAMFTYYHDYGSCYLVIEKDKNLMYGSDLTSWHPEEIEREGVIKYSQLIGKDTLKESDDFDWIRDVKATFTPEFPPKRGDVLICLPGFYGEDSVSPSDPSYGGYGYVEGRIIVVAGFDIDYDGPVGKNLVIWPDDDKSREYWDGNTSCFTCGIYNGALTYYTSDIIKESNDFD